MLDGGLPLDDLRRHRQPAPPCRRTGRESPSAVGGLEAENVMLGRASWMRLRTSWDGKSGGQPQPGITATDVVLALTEFLRKEKGRRCVPEFPWRRRRPPRAGDRATISNMAPEYGAPPPRCSSSTRRPSTTPQAHRSRRQAGGAGRTYAKTAGLWPMRPPPPSTTRTLRFDLFHRGAQHGRPVEPAQSACRPARCRTRASWPLQMPAANEGTCRTAQGSSPPSPVALTLEPAQRDRRGPAHAMPTPGPPASRR